ncbi:MAG: sigma-70 family RNA polymerase sigma factor [Planctomycetota bacterium]|nr:sigma-70 family RNA polymerase sigma factor [Planctomycetota bacterium]
MTDGSPAQALQAGTPAAALAARAKLGDRKAFGRLYELYGAFVHGVLLALVDPGQAQDLVQDVFLKALRSIRELEDPERFTPWLATIARNRGRDALRVRGQEPAELEGVPEPADDPPDDPDSDEEAALALATIRGLPAVYRETMMLRLVEGMSGPEIAERTGMTHGSVRVNLCRGMKLLRERMTREAG